MLYQRSDPRITTSNHINQAPILPPIHASRSVAYHAPSRIVMGNGPPTEQLTGGASVYYPAGVPWNAGGGQGAAFAQPRDWQGGWDAMGGRLMHVAQTDFIDTSPNVASGYNTSGIYDVPGASQGISFLRLNMTTSSRQVPSIPQGIWPTMFYQPPPSFSQQTVPVIAVGV